VKAYIGSSSSVRDIRLDNNVTITAQSLVDADAKATGVSGAVVGAGGSVSEARVTPNIDAYIGSKANVIANAGNITVRGLHNYYTSGSAANYVVSANSETSSGGLVT
jgi:hypothetical protein